MGLGKSWGQIGPEWGQTERKKEKTRHLVLGCRKLPLLSRALVQQAWHWLLAPSPAFQGTTCCPTWHSLCTKGTGGSSCTSCKQKSSRGHKDKKKEVGSRSAAPLGLQQLHFRYPSWEPQDSPSLWGQVLEKAVFLPSLVLRTQPLRFPLTNVLSY